MNIKEDILIGVGAIVVAAVIFVFAMRDYHHRHPFSVTVVPPIVIVITHPIVIPTPVVDPHIALVKSNQEKIHMLCEKLKIPGLPSTTVHAFATEIECLEATDAE